MIKIVFGTGSSARSPVVWRRAFSLSSVELREKIKGIFAPIITPFENHPSGYGSPAYKHLQENVNKLAKTKLRGFVVLGSNGEFPLLTKEEKLKVLEAAFEQRNNKIMIAGTGCVSTKETIELTNAAAKIGYEAAMVVTPYYYTSKMSSEVLETHFRAVADASDIPIILYNVPPFASVTMPVDSVCALSKHKNIIGVKDTTGSVIQISETSRNAADNFTILAGSAGYLLQSMASGAQGGVMALANILPDECCALFEYISAGNFVEAVKLQKQLVAVNDATSKYGVGGLKYACDILGYHGGKPRPPLLGLKPVQEQDIQKVLQAFGKKV